MATLVTFHAHPDDECIATGGVIAKAAAEGHRVVLVVATKGENGEVAPDFLAHGEPLWQRRVEETQAAAKVLGVARTEFLGYRDSGMMGTPENDAPDAFWQADVDEAAERLGRILRGEEGGVLTIYDDHGNYGHPDHIQVHRVGVRAAELAGTKQVYESTMNRDDLRRLMEMAREHNVEPAGEAEDSPDFDMDEFGSPEAIITTCVDVMDVIDRKRQAMVAHASQISENSFFLAMPPEAFAAAFGREWFIHRGVPADAAETSVI